MGGHCRDITGRSNSRSRRCLLGSDCDCRCDNLRDLAGESGCDLWSGSLSAAWIDGQSRSDLLGDSSDVCHGGSLGDSRDDGGIAAIR